MRPLLRRPRRQKRVAFSRWPSIRGLVAAYGVFLFASAIPHNARHARPALAAEAPPSPEPVVPQAVIPFPAQGGPFVALDPSRHETAPLDYPVHFPLDGVRRLMRALPMGAPLDDYEISSPFGRRRDPVTGRLALHAGIDLRAASRSQVWARSAGMVTFAGWRKGYGRVVEIDHGMGVSSLYGHLAQFSVRAGNTVEEGQFIGKVGSSGRSTGAHLHYEVRLHGIPRDPVPLIAMKPDVGLSR